MKLVKFLFALFVVSALVCSCKSEKKEASEAEDDAIEAVEESGEEADYTTEEGAAAVGESEESSAAAAESAIEGETKGLEEMDVPEGVVSEHLADTPVVYPGCDMATVGETRSCSKDKFIAFLQAEFNHDLAQEAGLGRGDYEIRSVVQIDKEGNCSALRVAAPNNQLKVEVERVIASLPKMTPATKAGEPIDVVFLLPVKFKVEKL